MSCAAIDKNLSEVVADFKAAEVNIADKQETSDSLDHELKAMDLPFELHNNSPLGPLIPLEDMLKLNDLEKVSKAMNLQVLKFLRFMQYVITNCNDLGLMDYKFCYPQTKDTRPIACEDDFKTKGDDLEFSYSFKPDEALANKGYFLHTAKSQSRNFALSVELDVDWEEKPDDSRNQVVLCNYEDADSAFKSNFLIGKKVNSEIPNTNFGYRLNSKQMQIPEEKSAVNGKLYRPEHSLHQANAYRYLLKSLGAPEKAENWESEFNQQQQALQ